MSKSPATPQATLPRREFLRNLALGGGFVGAAMLGILPVLQGWINHLRPPGALTAQKFLSSCIKCGQCVQVCPVEPAAIVVEKTGGEA